MRYCTHAINSLPGYRHRRSFAPPRCPHSISPERLKLSNDPPRVSIHETLGKSGQTRNHYVRYFAALNRSLFSQTQVTPHERVVQSESSTPQPSITLCPSLRRRYTQTVVAARPNQCSTETTSHLQHSAFECHSCALLLPGVDRSQPARARAFITLPRPPSC